MTNHHAKLFAHELTLEGGSGIERLKSALLSASVDLNPHQVEAALFALNSPLSNGVLLADEVGLGKTIEAGLVLCQFWAERKRRLLVVCPASLRKQWQIELEEKFNLPAIVLDAKTLRNAQRQGVSEPFCQQKILIVSYHFLAKNQDEVRREQWDLAVVDEAHKLRNSYKPKNRLGQSLRFALENRRKLLLTATPFQNNLSELYGVASILDENLFGDIAAFRTRYMSGGADLAELKDRLAHFCRRALRNDESVKTFVRYTSRRLLPIEFSPTNAEQALYEEVSKFLHREDLYSVPVEKRNLMLLGALKALASSPVALAGMLETYKSRLVAMRDGITQSNEENDDDILPADEDEFEEWCESLGLSPDGENCVSEGGTEKPDKIVPEKLNAEIAELENFATRARSLPSDTKRDILLEALEKGWKKMRELGAREKAVIFTESRRSMEYLRDFLNKNGYAGEVVCFSGGGKRDPETEKIYADYLAEHGVNENAGREAVLRHALIQQFKNKAKILIATEAGAEGINLQFCSLLINFDLPWNPQRIEQRIGRCHRYGQKHDVVIINFVNTRNAADVRVHELLNLKYRLFQGVLGASDDVLGSLDNSVGFEMQLLKIWQSCRTPEEIEAKFNELQEIMRPKIDKQMETTREQVLANLAHDVHTRLKIDFGDALLSLNDYELMFWRLSKFALAQRADFDDDKLEFRLENSPVPENAPDGIYALKQKRDVRESDDSASQPATAESPDSHIYRLNSALGEWCVSAGKNADTPFCELVFDLAGNETKFPALKNLRGNAGFLLLNDLIIKSIETEEFLLFSGFDDAGKNVPADILRDLFRIPATIAKNPPAHVPADAQSRLEKEAEMFAQATCLKAKEKSDARLDEKYDSLRHLAKDMEASAERELKNAKDALRAAELKSIRATNSDEADAADAEIERCKKAQLKARTKANNADDEIAEKIGKVIKEFRARCAQKSTRKQLFLARWRVI